MKKFKDLQISRKLTVGFLIVSIIATIIGAAGVFGMFQLSSASTKLYEKQTKPLSDISAIINTITSIRVQLRGAVIYCNDAEKLKAAEDEFIALDKALTQSIENYAPTIATAETRKIFDEAGKLYSSSFKPNVEYTFEIAKLGSFKEAQTSLTNMSGTTTQIIDNYQQCFDNRVANAKKTSEANTRLFIILTAVLAAVMIMGLVTAILLGNYISKIISRPIHKMVDAANEIALGNTNVNVDVENDDETGMLANSFNNMIVGIKKQVDIVSDIAEGDLTVDIDLRSDSDTMGIALKKTVSKLNDMFHDINQASEQVSIGSEQVSNGAQSLSQGTTEQASSIEELSATIIQLSSQVSENAEFATKGTIYMGKAIDGVAQCNEQMTHMLSSMEDINNSSSEISKIIKVIDDIAFQTNILALNAAVEAARAGSAGKGFAVVADEVRNLASKSADAAKQTTSLIEGSIKKVNIGAKIAEETAAALNDVEEKTKYIAFSIDKLASAANDQAAAIEQINVGVEQISSVIQTNSATAEESAASSEELSSQAGVLKQQISAFKLKQGNNREGRKLADTISLDEVSVDKSGNDYSSFDFEFGKY